MLQWNASFLFEFVHRHFPKNVVLLSFLEKFAHHGYDLINLHLLLHLRVLEAVLAGDPSQELVLFYLNFGSTVLVSFLHRQSYLDFYSPIVQSNKKNRQLILFHHLKAGYSLRQETDPYDHHLLFSLNGTLEIPPIAILLHHDFHNKHILHISSESNAIIPLI